MTVNVGSLDRFVRAVLGLFLIGLPFAADLFVTSPLLSYTSVAVGIVMLGVALTRVCPVYAVFGLKSCR